MTHELIIKLSIKDNTVFYTLYETTLHDPIILFEGSFKLNSEAVCGDMPVSAVLTLFRDPIIVSITNHCVVDTSYPRSIDLSDPKDPVSHALNYLVEKISSFCTELAAYYPEA